MLREYIVCRIIFISIILYIIFSLKVIQILYAPTSKSLFFSGEIEWFHDNILYFTASKNFRWQKKVLLEKLEKSKWLPLWKVVFFHRSKKEMFFLKEYKGSDVYLFIYQICSVQVKLTYKSASRLLAHNSDLGLYLPYKSTPKHTIGYQWTKI